jgi:hypothetical protein
MSEASNCQGNRRLPGILSLTVFARNDIIRYLITLNESRIARFVREQEKPDQVMDRISRKEAEDTFMFSMYCSAERESSQWRTLRQQLFPRDYFVAYGLLRMTLSGGWLGARIQCEHQNTTVVFY